jgi:hypothetical protein
MRFFVFPGFFKYVLLVFCLYSNSSILVDSWLKAPKGRQSFRLKKGGSAIFEWDFDNACWSFNYGDEVWHIKQGKLIKVKNGKEKKYSPAGLISLLLHPVSSWPSVLEIKEESCYNSTCVFFAYHKKNPILIRYVAYPFKLLGIESQDSSNNYYQLEFEE